MNRYLLTILDVIAQGGGDNLQRFNAAAATADAEFQARFLGIISGLVEPALWREAIERAKGGRA